MSFLLNGVAGSWSVPTSSTSPVTGEYAFVVNSTLASADQLVIYTANGVAFVENASGSVSGLNIYADYLAENAPSSNLTTVQTHLSAAIGANSSLLLNIGSATCAIDTTPQIKIGGLSASPTTLVLSTAGTVTQSAAITATSLDLLGSGATYTLSGPTSGQQCRRPDSECSRRFGEFQRRWQ